MFQRVIVGSKNPVKIAAVRAVVTAKWPHAVIEGLSVASGVPDQPWGDDETIRGAETRAKAALQAGHGDLGIGLEGGVIDEGSSVRTCAWCAAVDRDGRTGVGGSLSMPLPPRVGALVRGGMELGHAMDTVTGEHNVKHNAGAVGILTAGLVDRQRAYEWLVAYALAPWLGVEYWSE